MSEPKFKVGDRVYFVDWYTGNGLQSAIIYSATCYLDLKKNQYTTLDKRGNEAKTWSEDRLFPTKEALLEHIKQQLEELE